MLKINPNEHLTETEIYLQNFWQPKEGHTITCENMEYEIEAIVKDAQIKCKGAKRIMWLQDTGWKPTLKDLDDVVSRLGGEIISDTICVPIKHTRSYFVRPSTVEEYEGVIRQIRTYAAINGGAAHA